MRNEQSYVYLLTHPRNTALYTGVTNDFIKRLFEHKQKLVAGFAQRYNATKLVYYEQFDSIVTAIEREKQIKSSFHNVISSPEGARDLEISRFARDDASRRISRPDGLEMTKTSVMK